MKRVHIVFLSLIFFTIGWGTEITYSLRDCFQLAISRSESLANQQDLVIQAEEHYKQAFSGLFPTVYGSYSYTRQDPGAAGNQADLTTAKIVASQPLFHGFRILGAIQQNLSLLNAQKQAYQWAAYQLYADVSQAYFLLLSLKQDKQLLLQEMQLYTKRMHELNDRVQIGKSRETEVLTLQVSMAQLEATIEQTQQQILVAQDFLVFLTGVDKIPNLSDNSALMDLLPLEKYESYIDKRPDIIAAQHKIDSAKTGTTLAAESQWLPNVDLGSDYYFSHNAPLTGVAWDATIQLTLPNFIGYNNQSKTDEALAIQHQAEVALMLLRRQVKENIDDAFQALKSDQQQIKSLEKASTLSDKNVQTVMEDYRHGLNNNLDVLQALNSAVDIKRSLNKVRYAFQSDLARMTALTATVPLPDVLK